MSQAPADTTTNSFNLDAVLRDGHGKGAARRLRRQGLVPAVVYAGGSQALSIAVAPKEIAKAVQGPRRRNALIHLNLKDASGKSTGTKPVMVKELQIDPLRRGAVHIDFQEVSPTKPIAVRVPFETSGKSQAIVQGAKLQIVVKMLKVQVSPEAIPVKIVCDITNQGFGFMRAKEVPLPAGVTLLEDPEQPVISLRMPRGEKEDEAAATTAAAPAAGAKGAAAAPAAAAKAPAKK
jgi:large subunit ribosomal protein L25